MFDNLDWTVRTETVRGEFETVDYAIAEAADLSAASDDAIDALALGIAPAKLRELRAAAR